MIKADLSQSKYLLIAGICLLVFTFINKKKEKEDIQPSRDLQEIMSDGVLKVATEYNSSAFYVDGDTLSGFHYSLINKFAKEQNLEVEITPIMSVEERIHGLELGNFDVIACNTPISSGYKDSILFTTPILLDQQVLVQRKKRNEDDSIYIDSQVKLAERTIHLVKGSDARLRLNNIIKEIGDTIYINEIEKYGTEQLIAMVAHGDIDYAVCEKETVEALRDSFPNIDAETEIGFAQFQGWAVNKNSLELLDSLNSWLNRYKKSKEFNALLKKHY